MSRILENKQIIHIVCEIIVIIGIVFYFSQKNKKLMNHINDLTQRLEDLEDTVQKQEKNITKLLSIIEKLNVPQKQNKNETFVQKPIPNPSPNIFSIPISSPFGMQGGNPISSMIFEAMSNIHQENQSENNNLSENNRVEEIIDDKEEDKEEDNEEYKKEYKEVDNEIKKESKKVDKKSAEDSKKIKKDKKELDNEEEDDEDEDEDLDEELKEELSDLN